MMRELIASVVKWKGYFLICQSGRAVNANLLCDAFNAIHRTTRSSLDAALCEQLTCVFPTLRTRSV